MKALLFGLTCLCSHFSSFGQGQISFNNQMALTDPQYGIYFNGVPAGEIGMNATLFLVNGNSLTALTPSTTFFTEPGSQFLLQPVDITVPGILPGASANFLVRVWDSSFASYDAAISANAWRGQSLSFVNKVGGGTLPPENTVFTGFVLIPEPSIIALAIMGAGSLLFRRRK